METGGTLLQVFAALVVTLGLVFACAFAVRRFGGMGVRGGEIIRVLGAAPIGTRERVLLLKVHGRQLLVGVTANAITPLHVFETDVPDVPVVQHDFKAILKGLAQK
jgi:flagellar protein FliO/FliZ